MAQRTPSQLVQQLDQTVIGQDSAKRTLAVALHTHRLRLAQLAVNPLSIDKSNVLLIGPTGTGKTLLCETLARLSDLPFVTADATALAQSQFVGNEVEALLQRLVDRAAGQIAQAEQGIVFIDEIDKLKQASGNPLSSQGERVQHALLKIMESALVRLPDGRSIDTSQILFICGGAFVGLDGIMERRHSFGFIATDQRDDSRILARLNARVKPTDLLEFGLIPEFAGRLPVVARLHDLTVDHLMRILVEPRQALYRQFQALLAASGVELRIAPGVFRQMAELAVEYKAGARSLRGIFQEMMTDVLYTLPDQTAVRRVSIRSLFEAPVFETTIPA
ncbi:MAG: AAA family ATPase [Dechloromonas sp.]|nr:AAA family ATPase [Dechloromonas sp.]